MRTDQKAAGSWIAFVGGSDHEAISIAIGGSDQVRGWLTESRVGRPGHIAQEFAEALRRQTCGAQGSDTRYPLLRSAGCFSNILIGRAEANGHFGFPSENFEFVARHDGTAAIQHSPGPVIERAGVDAGGARCCHRRRQCRHGHLANFKQIDELKIDAAGSITIGGEFPLDRVPRGRDRVDVAAAHQLKHRIGKRIEIALGIFDGADQASVSGDVLDLDHSADWRLFELVGPGKDRIRAEIIELPSRDFMLIAPDGRIGKKIADDATAAIGQVDATASANKGSIFHQCIHGQRPLIAGSLLRSSCSRADTVDWSGSSRIASAAACASRIASWRAMTLSLLLTVMVVFGR